ncbi:MAG: phospholipid carrier-dependent glycosyltransferase, partial [Clostridia bacterium]|nr:phospholipid carrier-dependent glycosyltransferase [Clostridia bacterium]
EEGVKAGTWQKLYNYNTPTDATYYIIATLNAVEINELAFVGVVKDGTDGAYKNEKVLLNVTPIGAGIKGVKGSSSESWSKSLEHSSNILDMTEYGVKQASKLIDEQSAFKPEKLSDGVYTDTKVFSSKELTFAKTVNSIFGNNASTIDSTENPVGLILVSISTLIFGTTTFTLRLVPILFAIGSIVLAYFIAKKFIKNEYICAGVSGAIAVANLILIITTAFTWAIGIFFILLSIYFVLRYFLLKKLKSNDFITYLVLGGLSYALAIGVKTVAMFLAPLFFVAIGYIIYTRYNKAIAKIKDGKTRVARMNMYREIACSVISFIVIPVIVLSLSFLVVAPALSSVYGGGLFSVASKQFFAIF